MPDRGSRRDLTEAERADWDRYVRHCRLLPARASEDGGGGASAIRYAAPRRSLRAAPVRHRLDLHGHTAHQAHQAVFAFVQQAHAAGLRQIEIVTGLGGGEAGGVLRRELPFWLDDPRLQPLILKLSPPHAANPGALRVALRRIKSASLRG